MLHELLTGGGPGTARSLIPVSEGYATSHVALKAPAINEQQRHEKQSKACTMRERAEGVQLPVVARIQLRAASFLNEH